MRNRRQLRFQFLMMACVSLLKFSFIFALVFFVPLLSQASIAPSLHLYRQSLPPNSCSRQVRHADYSHLREKHVREAILGIVDYFYHLRSGQDNFIQKVLIASIAGEHTLIQVPPGAPAIRTLKSFAHATQSSWNHIQFESQLTVNELLGWIEHESESNTKLLMGNQLAFNFVIGENIHRASENVVQTFMDLMEEQKFSVRGHEFQMPEIFHFLALHSPEEPNSTMELTRFQQDKFMMKILADYPPREHQRMNLRQIRQDRLEPSPHQKNSLFKGQKVVTQKAILAARQYAMKTQIPAPTEDYILSILEISRQAKNFDKQLSRFIRMGAAQKAAESLLLSSMAMAWLRGNARVEFSDVDAVAHEVLRHRIALSDEAISRGISVEQVIDKIVSLAKVRYYHQGSFPY